MTKFVFGYIFIVVSTASAAPQSYFPDSGLTQELYEYLDFKSFRSSFGPKLDRVRTLKDFVKFDCPSAKLSSDEGFFEVNCPDWYYKLEVIARDDFDKDGIEDVRFKFTDRSKAGSYDTTSIVTVTRKKEGGPIVFAGIEKEKELVR